MWMPWIQGHACRNSATVHWPTSRMIFSDSVLNIIWRNYMCLYFFAISTRYQRRLWSVITVTIQADCQVIATVNLSVSRKASASNVTYQIYWTRKWVKFNCSYCCHTCCHYCGILETWNMLFCFRRNVHESFLTLQMWKVLNEYNRDRTVSHRVKVTSTYVSF